MSNDQTSHRETLEDGTAERERERDQALRCPKAYHSIKQLVVGRAEGLRVGNADPYALQKERKIKHCIAK